MCLCIEAQGLFRECGLFCGIWGPANDDVGGVLVELGGRHAQVADRVGSTDAIRHVYGKARRVSGGRSERKLDGCRCYARRLGHGRRGP